MTTGRYALHASNHSATNADKIFYKYWVHLHLPLNVRALFLSTHFQVTSVYSWWGLKECWFYNVMKMHWEKQTPTFAQHVIWKCKYCYFYHVENIFYQPRIPTHSIDIQGIEHDTSNSIVPKSVQINHHQRKIYGSDQLILNLNKYTLKMYLSFPFNHQ